jgi:hypothetical protein
MAYARFIAAKVRDKGAEWRTTGGKRSGTAAPLAANECRVYDSHWLFPPA